MIAAAEGLVLRIRRLLRSRAARRGQILVLAVVFIFMFLLVATILIDVYHIEEARNWGYRAAQQAALAGTLGTGTAWTVYQPTVDPTLGPPTPYPSGCIDPVRIELNAAEAYDAAQDMLLNEMGARGFAYPGDFEYEIRILPNVDGGTTAGFPPNPVRLGAGRGEWSASNPAVGVYLYFDVHTFLMSLVGRPTVTVHVFAAAEAAEPPMCPP
jgi:hypothetical protein